MAVDMKHMEFLEGVLRDDLARVQGKEATYKGSWKKRGGVGAFMMLARKWDRLEGIVEQDKFDCPENRDSQHTYCAASKWDVIAHALLDPTSEEGALEQITDLRCYLLLLEAEIRAQQHATD